MHDGDWRWRDVYPDPSGTGTAHSCDSGFRSDPVVIKGRPIGFGADVDSKPVVRMPYRRRPEGKK